MCVCMSVCVCVCVLLCLVVRQLSLQRMNCGLDSLLLIYPCKKLVSLWSLTFKERSYLPTIPTLEAGGGFWILCPVSTGAIRSVSASLSWISSKPRCPCLTSHLHYTPAQVSHIPAPRVVSILVNKFKKWVLRRNWHSWRIADTASALASLAKWSPMDLSTIKKADCI